MLEWGSNEKIRVREHLCKAETLHTQSMWVKREAQDPAPSQKACKGNCKCTVGPTNDWLFWNETGWVLVTVWDDE